MPRKKKYEDDPNASPVTPRNFLSYIGVRIDEVKGIKLRDGSIIIGKILEIVKDDDGIIWIDFEGVSPSSVPTESLSVLLSEGLRSPDTLLMRILVPVPDIHYFFYAFTTVKLQEKFLENLKKERDTNLRDPKILSLNKEKVNTSVKTEKIKKDKKLLN